MRHYQDLDSTALRAFYFAGLTLNFTQAARHAGLTQSGVSQHVQKLERSLGYPLFLRLGKTLKLSPSGLQLLKFCEQYLEKMDALFESIARDQREISGLVRYAMPSSCLMSPHFSMLLKKRTGFPRVQLNVRIMHSDLVLEALLKNEIDFGFSTRFLPHAQIEFLPFVEEEYVLVASTLQLKPLKQIADLLDFNFLNYPGMDDLYSAWAVSQFGNKDKTPLFSELHIKDEISDLRGAIELAINGQCFGFFPRHCVEKELSQKTLYPYFSKIKAQSKNHIYIVRHKEAPKLARIETVLNAFWEMAK